MLESPAIQSPLRRSARRSRNSSVMAGHSKWANIQHRKGAQDAKRGKLFTKLIRELSIATRLGGADPASNFRLRHAIDKALDGNVTKDTIERAIKRAAGEIGSDELEEIRYEGYGPNGVAVMVECMTDNRNRTVADVRHAFTKCGGNLGTDGSVGYLFRKVGELCCASGIDEDRLMEVAIEAGAEDVIGNDDESIDVITGVDEFSTVKQVLADAGFVPDSSGITMRPANWVALEAEEAQRMMKLLDMLEDLDDVQQVHSNADISESVLATLA